MNDSYVQILDKCYAIVNIDPFIDSTPLLT